MTRIDLAAEMFVCGIIAAWLALFVATFFTSSPFDPTARVAVGFVSGAAIRLLWVAVREWVS